MQPLQQLVTRCAAGILAGAGIWMLGISEAEGAQVRPFLESYCIKCHGGEKVKGKLDFRVLLEEDRDMTQDFEIWAKVLGVMEDGEMPPEQEKVRPSDIDMEVFSQWYRRKFVDSIRAEPGAFRVRRLSVIEFRHSLRSMLGFDLEVAIREAEQTVAETSLVMKLMPTDPPGASGFTNDTSTNPLSTVSWERYAFLVDAGLAELFSPARRSELEAYVGKLGESGLPTHAQAAKMVRTFLPKAWRRPIPEKKLLPYLDALNGLDGQALANTLRGELKAALLSPAFLYRGLLAEGRLGTTSPVDEHELAERIAYFLWADLPDTELTAQASNGTLRDPEVLAAQVNRMLDDPRARSLAEVFATQWLSLDQVAHGNVNVPKAHALKSQPLDYMDYLFREDRPLTELVESRVAFANQHTQGYYPGDNRRMVRLRKPRGIEQQKFPNQKLELEQVKERGGVLTIPGVLAMNRGPVTRGVWILERILGEHLGEPPPDVGQVPPSPRGQNLSFRERFEMHRSKTACAVCHNKIDPLGFALQAYDGSGGFRQNTKSADTAGRLPSGETFEDFPGLRRILVTSQKRTLVRNIVERTLSYALCRKLEIHDQPTVTSLTERLHQGESTFRELVTEVISSLPFQQAKFPKNTP